MKGAEKILAALKSGKISKETAAQLYADLQDKNAPVVNEMHPDIDFTTRLVYKNFSADPEASFNYLQKKHPELNFKKDASGNVLAKKPGESSWYRLDPEGFDLQDITDVGYDVVAGIGEGAASVAGGLAGGAAGLPTGPGAIATGLGGAAAAGGAAGAGLEALRNQIGQFAGIDQEQSLSDVGTAAAFGAASPLLFGTGAAGKQVAKQALKSGLDDAGAMALKNTQRGLLSRGKDVVAPRIGEQISGIPKRFLTRASKELDNIDDYNAVEALEGVRNTAFDAQAAKMDEVGNRIGEIIDGAEGTVDLTGVQKEYQDLITKYTARAEKLGTQSAKDDLDFVQEAYKNYIPELTDIDGQTAISLKRDLNDITRIKKKNAAGFDTQAFKLSEAEKDLARVSKKAAVKLDDAITSSVEGGAELKKANREYGKLIEGQQVLQKYFKDEDATKRTLQKVLKGDKVNPTAKKLKEVGVEGLEDLAEKVKTKDIFADPDSQILSMGKSSTGRNVALQGAGLVGGSYLGSEYGGGTGAAIGAGLGSFAAALGSPRALKAYLKANQMGGKAIQSIQNAPIVPYAPNIQGTINILDNIQRSESGN